MKTFNPLAFLIKTQCTIIKLCFTSLLLIVYFQGYTQENEWIKAIGGTNVDIIQSVKTDPDGNVYACGYFSGTVDFNTDETATDEYTATGSSAAFITKYSSNGAYQWTTVLNGTQHNWLFDLTIMSAGNQAGIYVAGAYSGNIDLDPGENDIIYYAEDSYDAFVAGYSLSTGVLISHYVYSGTNIEMATNITCIGDNNIIVAGKYRGQIDFTPESSGSIFTSEGESDIFLRNFSPAGGPFWTKSIGGVGIDRLTQSIFKKDASNNLYLCGDFQGTVAFDPDMTQTHELTSEGGKDAFILKITNDATFEWVAQFGSANDEIATALAIGDDTIYSAISFTNTLSVVTGYAAGTPIYDDYTSNGGIDVLLAMHTIAGDIIGEGTAQIGGDADDYCNSLTADTLGNIYATGSFASSDFDIDPRAGVEVHASQGLNDIFLASFSTNFDYQWANFFGSADNEEGLIVIHDSISKLYTIGTFDGTVNFGANEVTSLGQEDFFINKTHILNTETEILSFEIPEAIAPAIIDPEASTIDNVVGYGVDLTSLVPTITISMGASIDPPGGEPQDFTNPRIYTVLAENGSDVQHWTVTVTENPNNATEILTFELAEATGPAEIDPVAGTVEIEVNYGADLTSLAPTITLSPGAVIDPASGTTQDFSNSVDYTVTAENGTDSQVWNVSVTEAVSVIDPDIATLTIYPNPASDALSIMAETSIYAIKLYDMTGRLVKSKIINSHKGTFSVQQLPEGIYFINIQTKEGKTATRRLIVKK